MNGLPFIKMHGLGNDFVVLDGRAQTISFDQAQAKRVADRNTGIGCDQLIVIEAARDSQADAFMRIRNADGHEVAACGNAARCIADILMQEKGSDHAIIETNAGLLDAEARDGGLVAVDMGLVRHDWRDIPLSKAVDTLHMGIEHGPLKDPVGVNIGNPHAVFFVDDAEAIPLDVVGPVIEHHEMFPEFANVGAAQVIDSETIRLRVWERGSGLTQACGTGACAALVAAHRRGLTGRVADVRLDGGTLRIDWLPDNHVMMTGAVATSFTGTLYPSLLE